MIFLCDDSFVYLYQSQHRLLTSWHQLWRLNNYASCWDPREHSSAIWQVTMKILGCKAWKNHKWTKRQRMYLIRFLFVFYPCQLCGLKASPVGIPSNSASTRGFMSSSELLSRQKEYTQPWFKRNIICHDLIVFDFSPVVFKARELTSFLPWCLTVDISMFLLD